MAEFPTIGKHCSIKSCQRLDFLPFECDGCLNIYCADHKTKDSHDCTLVNIDKPSEYSGTKGYGCSVDDCNGRELMPVICDKCHGNFCLSHRHQVDHQCKELVVRETPNKAAEHVKKILASKSHSTTKNKLRSSKSNKTAEKVALMKLKMKAVGETGVPEDDKVFFLVLLPAEHKIQSIPMYFSKTWTVGRAIDSIASRSKLHNPNNTGADKKLRLFSHNDGCLLPTEQTLVSQIGEENGLRNGSDVVLEYVGSDCLLLENMEKYKVS
ncbi:hypothetical protein ScPMuIL_002015 [Solemya velum]